LSSGGLCVDIFSVFWVLFLFALAGAIVFFLLLM
jgi:hypothetical protein